MGKLQEFSVVFNNNVDVFQNGQWVCGQVVVNLNEAMKMRGIRLKFKGHAYVHWTEEHGSGDNRHTESYSASETYFEHKVTIYGKGVRLKFHGHAYVHWTEQHSTGSGKNRRTTTRHYSASETYFQQKVTLFGKDEGQSGDNPTLPAGRHVFPFQYQLPQQGLPCSFEGAHGYVRYYLKGTIDKPWKFDHTVKRAFTVLDMYDLNEEPTALTPMSGQKSKMLCCLCCASGPIELQAQTDRTAYCPGETVQIRGTLENNANEEVTRVSAKLIQHVSFHATSKSRSSSSTLSKTECQGCAEGQSSQVEMGLTVPAIPPSSLRYCSIIDIDYTLEISGHIGGAHTSMDMNFPIKIGFIPLRSYYPSPPSFPAPPAAYPAAPYPPGPDAAYPPPAGLPYPHLVVQPYPPGGDAASPLPGGYPSAPPAGMMPSAPPPVQPVAGAPGLPPPSYAECETGKANIKDSEDSEYTMGNMDFAPKYTYYDWSKHPQV
ncbi:PREDICTED: arrestin domain-containing protein 3-like [Branchiostoma belcheri]|uniref:Arrestin domain-containing protein 3-like n=1 Tax=Branchiostoma belcheri TaxID=7741 RepID=A0A6P4ZP56_BRABE|nr:PREDICTED: arrestin domain-containing protein 3-like [Branchiostoma belcheri]